MLRLSKLTDYAVVVLVRLSQVDAAPPEAGRVAAGSSPVPPGPGMQAPPMQTSPMQTSPMQTSPGIAAATGIPEPTVAKVLKILAGGGLVASQRGARGGYRLMRPLSAIPIADVIAAIDGPIALTACVEGSPGGCEAEGTCPMRGRWDPVNSAIREALREITLADMQAAAIPRAFRMPALRPADARASPATAPATPPLSPPAAE